MYLKTYKVIIFSTFLLISVNAYSSHSRQFVDTLKNEEEHIDLNKTKSEVNERNVQNNSYALKNNSKSKEFPNNSDQLNKSTILFSSKVSALTFLNIPYTNNVKAIETLKASNQSKINNKNNFSDIGEMKDQEQLTMVTIINKTTETPTLRKSNDDDISLSNITNLSLEGSGTGGQSKINNKNNSSDISEMNNKEHITMVTLIDKTTEPKSNDDDINLSELINLSLDGSGTVGQKIAVQRSPENSDTDMSNPIGVEVLKNMSRVCGTQLGKRISFAEPTTLMELPWTVLLLYNTNIRYHCGGSLITTKYVLTAAHCVAQEFYELSGVRLGEYDITEEKDCAPDIVGQLICATTLDVDVVKIIVHHAYSHVSFKNDIALLKLDNDYFGRSFYPICIDPEWMEGNREATVAGWGATEKTIRSSILLRADVPILNMSKCREVYRYNVFNDTTEICGSGTNEIDVCKGDSGGALFYSKSVNQKDKYFQLGIISLGVRRCGDSRFLPAVFTKLSGFYKWIENNIEI